MGGHLSVSHDEATNNSAINIDFLSFGEASAIGSLIVAIFGDFYTMTAMGWTITIVNGKLTIRAPTGMAGSMAPTITEMIGELSSSETATAGVVAGAVHKIRSSFSSRRQQRQDARMGHPALGDSEHVSQTMRGKFQQLLARKKAEKALDSTYGSVDQRSSAQQWTQQGYPYAIQPSFSPSTFPGAAESALVPHDPRMSPPAAWPNQQAFHGAGAGVGYTPAQHNGYLTNDVSPMMPHDARGALTPWTNQTGYHNGGAQHAPLQQNMYLTNEVSPMMPHGVRNAPGAWDNQSAYQMGGVEQTPLPQNGFLAKASDLMRHGARSAPASGAKQQGRQKKNAEQARFQQNGYLGNELALVPHDATGASVAAGGDTQAPSSRGAEQSIMQHNGYLENGALGGGGLVPYAQHAPPAWGAQTYGYPGSFYCY